MSRLSIMDLVNIIQENSRQLGPLTSSTAPRTDRELACIKRIETARMELEQRLAAHQPPSTEAAAPAASEETLSAMNSALCDFALRWKMDGDYLRCTKCKRPIIASHRLEFVHQDGCKAAGKVEAHPWAALIEILRPLIAAQPPAPSDVPMPTKEQILQIRDEQLEQAHFESNELWLVEFARAILRAYGDARAAQAVKASEKDAQRYRWLREQHRSQLREGTIGYPVCIYVKHSTPLLGYTMLDTIVDAALAKEKGE